MEKNISVHEFRLKVKMLLLAIVFALLSAEVDGEIISKKEFLEIQRRLKMLNKPSLKSIKSEDGDIIDCVDIYKQPAFDHPALKNHTIQMKPSYDLTTMETTKTKTNGSSTAVISQLWKKSGSCPKGTVPIRRIRKRDLLRSVSLESYGRKKPSIPDTKGHLTEGSNITLHVPQANRSLTYLLTQGYNYIGAKGDINVWNPRVISMNEYSSAQIWLRNGPPSKYESVESGWVVNPNVYGDTQVRLFAYWTVDSSTKTGCFDLTCPGFVQTSNEIALGSVLDPVSEKYGNQYHITITLYLDSNNGNWWLHYGNMVIGYWPGSLFSLLSHSAIYVMWGGEVYSSTVRKPPHTTTQMGSGGYAENLFGSACFIRSIRILDYSLSWKFPEWVHPAADEEYCYHACFRGGYIVEPEFYFGGPGQSYLCP